MSNKPVDLKVLNNLVKALNDQITYLDSHASDKSISDEDFVVEVARAMGVASGIALEATALVGDMTRGFSAVSAPKSASSKVNPDDILNSIFGAKPIKN